MKAKLHIQVADRAGCSYLKKAFFSTPFKVANITEDKGGNPLRLMLMSSSPGILDGDHYDMKIELGSNAALQLHTQAYQRLFNMKRGASQQLEVRLENGASLVYLPHPSVPHEQSAFVSRNNFYLGNNCRLVFGEILTCGRKLNGEAFLFSKYHSISQVFINNKLVIKENLLMQPAEIDVYELGQLEGYSHQTSMIFLDEAGNMPELKVALLELLAEQKDIEYGITAAPINGLLVRVLGYGAEQLFKLMNDMNEIIAEGCSRVELEC